MPIAPDGDRLDNSIPDWIGQPPHEAIAEYNASLVKLEESFKAVNVAIKDNQAARASLESTTLLIANGLALVNTIAGKMGLMGLGGSGPAPAQGGGWQHQLLGLASQAAIAPASSRLGIIQAGIPSLLSLLG